MCLFGSKKLQDRAEQKLPTTEQLSQMGGDHVANSMVGCNFDSGPEIGIIPINPVIELKVSCQRHF